MPKKIQRSVFWVVSTHVLTTGFAMPFVASFFAGAAIFALRPPPIASFLILLAMQAIGYVGGVFYSLSYIRKVAILQNPVACIKPSIVTFTVLAIFGLGVNLVAHFGREKSEINSSVVVITLIAFYAVIGVAFAKFTRDGFSQMPSGTTGTD